MRPPNEYRRQPPLSPNQAIAPTIDMAQRAIAEGYTERARQRIVRLSDSAA
jgi:hypothetical protein